MTQVIKSRLRKLRDCLAKVTRLFSKKAVSIKLYEQKRRNCESGIGKKAVCTYGQLTCHGSQVLQIRPICFAVLATLDCSYDLLALHTDR